MILKLLTRSFIFSFLTNIVLIVAKLLYAVIITAIFLYGPIEEFEGEDVSVLSGEVAIGGDIFTSFLYEFILGFVVVSLVFLLGYKLKLIK